MLICREKVKIAQVSLQIRHISQRKQDNQARVVKCFRGKRQRKDSEIRSLMNRMREERINDEQQNSCPRLENLRLCQPLPRTEITGFEKVGRRSMEPGERAGGVMPLRQCLNGV